MVGDECLNVQIGHQYVRNDGFNTALNADILLFEVLSAVKTLYNHKASDRDEVFCEIIKQGGLKCYEIMTKLFNTCLKQHFF